MDQIGQNESNWTKLLFVFVKMGLSDGCVSKISIDELGEN